jgi:hypothetical protein
MPGRRSFLIGCGSMVALPAFGGIAQPWPSRDVSESIPSAVACEQPELNGSHDLAFRIDGWDSPFDPQPAHDGRPTIRISSSWQAAWR